MVRWISRILGHRYQHFIEGKRDVMRTLRETNWKVPRRSDEFDGRWEETPRLLASDWLSFHRQEQVLARADQRDHVDHHRDKRARKHRRRVLWARLDELCPMSAFDSARHRDEVKAVVGKVRSRTSSLGDLQERFDKGRLLESTLSRESLRRIEHVVEERYPLRPRRKLSEGEEATIVLIAGDNDKSLEEAMVWAALLRLGVRSDSFLRGDAADGDTVQARLGYRHADCDVLRLP